MRTRIWFRAFLLFSLVAVGTLGWTEYLRTFSPKRAVVNCIDDSMEWMVYLPSRDSAYSYIDYVRRNSEFSVCSVIDLSNEEDEE